MEFLLIHIAALFTLSGFLARDQIVLRSLLICGQTLNIFFFLQQSYPILSPLGWNVLFVFINIFIIVQIYLERSNLKLSEKEIQLYHHFSALNPGEFRKLSKITHWSTITRKKRIIKQGKAPDQLYFILQGKAEIIKENKTIKIGAGFFVGELSFLNKSVATADVKLLSKAQIVYWHTSELSKLLSTRPQMRISFNNLINKDLANKLSTS